MHTQVHRDAIQLLLRSMYKPQGTGQTQSFLSGPVGAKHWEKNLIVRISYEESLLVKAILHVRREGPSYIRKIPISEIRSMLMNFVSEYYCYFADDLYFQDFKDSYAENTSKSTEIMLAEALATSEIFHPQNELTLFPLIPVQVKDDFDSDTFFLIDAASLNVQKLPRGLARDIVATQFPPTRLWGHRKEKPSSWLGIRSPALHASKRMKASIIGALALTLIHRCRYMFSMRPMFGGWCAVGNCIRFEFSDPITPAVAEDISITKIDHKWLKTLSEKLTEENKTTQREMRALEYYYRAWFLDPSERFPVLYMTLDSIFGDASHASGSVINGIRSLLGNHIGTARLRLLSDLRAAVIHGGAPEVYDSSKYPKYYEKYDADPIRDLDLVVAECLRKRIFGEALKEHPDPHAEQIAKAIAADYLRPSEQTSILEVAGED